MGSDFILSGFLNRARCFSGTLIHQVAESVPMEYCTDSSANECRNDETAFRLKLVAIAAILVSGIVGVSAPLVGRKHRYLRTNSGLFLLAKAFSAGVILATGFVHMLHDAEVALTNTCLPEVPWRRFPFPGFVAMVSALCTLVADVVATQFYNGKHREEAARSLAEAAAMMAAEEGIVASEASPDVVGDNAAMRIVGNYANPAEGEVSSHVRNVVVSQILELGIVSHSVIIGLSLGVSQSPCAIRPLVAALCFHQFFEGFALGGCISQAQFGVHASLLMSFFFAVTTPMGIAGGGWAVSFFDPHSARALAVEGLLDSVSAGILIYMALVDLIAADFLSRPISSSARMQFASYAALFLGAAAMSALAIWA